MDKLAKRLQSDAADIDVRVSDELDDRIEAALAGVRQAAAPSRDRPGFFWWASSLTGVAAVAAVLLVIRLTQPEPPPLSSEPPLQPFSIPRFDWKPKTALLTESLQQELQDIQSDLKKAEQVVIDDLEEIGVAK